MLQQFEQDLTRIIGNPTDLRPFVCEGSPLRCTIFIVGLNPATELKRSFWDFWRADYGFNKTEWFEVYKEERRKKPLKQGKTRRNEVSNTRRVIKWMVDEAVPEPCLETNIYSKPSEETCDLEDKNRVTKPFDFLLKEIQPKVLLVHGDKAIKHIESTFRKCLIKDDIVEVNTEWGCTKILAVPHLSRGWSRVRAQETGRRLKAAVR